jgi:hypothetical protein
MEVTVHLHAPASLLQQKNQQYPLIEVWVIHRGGLDIFREGKGAFPVSGIKLLDCSCCEVLGINERITCNVIINLTLPLTFRPVLFDLYITTICKKHIFPAIQSIK